MPQTSAMKRLAVAAVALAAAAAIPAFSQHTEESARQAAQEVKLLVGEGTAVIGDLQPSINSGKAAKDQVSPDALVTQFKARYQKAAGMPLDTKAPGLMGDARRAYLQATEAQSEEAPNRQARRRVEKMQQQARASRPGASGSSRKRKRR